MYGLIRLIYNVILLLVLPVILVLVKFRADEIDLEDGSLAHRLGFFAGDLGRELTREQPVIWVHAVSVGEVQAARELIKQLKAEEPTYQLVLTTTTTTGRQAAERDMAETVDLLLYLPFDLPWAVGRLVKTIRPSLLVTVETEIWPNLLFAAERGGAEVVMVNGRISDRSAPRYRRMRCMFRKVLDHYCRLAVISERDAQRLIASGAEPKHITVTGNMKYDRIPGPKIPGGGDAVQRELGVPKSREVIVAGSTHPGEEEILLDACRELKEDFPELTLIIAPRNIERKEEIRGLAAERGFSVIAKTELIPEKNDSQEVIILDTIGDLFRTYAVGTICFCGGSLIPGGGQNILEPAAWGRVVLHGPHMENFRQEQRILAESGGAITVEERKEFVQWARRLLSNPRERKKRGDAARSALLANQGASRRNADLISEILNTEKESPA